MTPFCLTTEIIGEIDLNYGVLGDNDPEERLSSLAEALVMSSMSFDTMIEASLDGDDDTLVLTVTNIEEGDSIKVSYLAGELVVDGTKEEAGRRILNIVA